jgi:YjbE family integral membrane protein
MLKVPVILSTEDGSYPLYTSERSRSRHGWDEHNVYAKTRKKVQVNLSILAAVGSIALVDIVLSGDNALVIGAAASRLPRGQRLVAVIWGGLGAIVLRLILAVAATELLTVEYLQAIGGIVLFIITIRLLFPEDESRRARPAADRFLNAIATIMLADVTMSLDNVLAVGALAAGNIPLLVAGLILSMVLLFVASTLIARLMDRFKWLLDVAAVILGWTTANLILQDPAVATLMGLKSQPNVTLAIHFAFVALVLLVDLFLRAFLVHREWRRKSTTASDARDPVSVPTARSTADRPPSTRPTEAASQHQSSASAPLR